MEEDNETTATQLHKMLEEKGYNLSLKTIITCCSQLGWTYYSSKYCQLVHTCTRNEEKRLMWAKQCQNNKSFNTVIFTDETSVQLY